MATSAAEVFFRPFDYTDDPADDDDIAPIFQESSRDTYETDWTRNVGKIVPGVNDYGKCGFKAYEQERETTNIRDRSLNLKKDLTMTMRPFDRFKVTHRQTRQSRRNGNLGSKHIQRGGYHVAKFRADPTHRESAVLHDYKGPARRNTMEPMDQIQYREGTYIQGLREATIAPYTPGPAKNYYSNGAADTFVSIRKQLGNQETDRSVAMKTRLYENTTNSGNHGMVTTIKNNVPVYNTYYDPSIIRQLDNNPFVIH